MSQFLRLCVLSILMSTMLSSQINAQQTLSFIRVSPKASVTQNIGFASIHIDYSRPGVKGREVYGKLVPYGLAPNPFGNGKPMPWRAGANENTTIAFSHDVTINGNELKAGTFGVHMIVYEDEWTIIFSNDHKAWGSYFYEKENDALRIKVEPEEAEHREWLMFGFENLTENSADVFMHWGKKKVGFTVETGQHAVVLDTYREELTQLPGFNQAAWGAAARYCLQNEVNLEEAMIWIDKALTMNGGDNFNNNAIKAGLLSLQGRAEEGDELLEASLETASEAELNTYGYQLMGQGRLEEALTIFRMNVKRHPDSWNVYDSLGEALAKKGEMKNAKKNYEIAYEKAPSNQKARIEAILKGL